MRLGTQDEGHFWREGRGAVRQAEGEGTAAGCAAGTPERRRGPEEPRPSAGSRRGGHVSPRLPPHGRDWGQEEKRVTEDERAGWHHQLYEHRVWANSGRYWRLTCFSPWGCKELDTTEWTATTNFLAEYLTVEPKQQNKQAYFMFSTCGVDMRIAYRMRPSLCRVLFWLLNPHLIKKFVYRRQ